MNVLDVDEKLLVAYLIEKLFEAEVIDTETYLKAEREVKVECTKVN